MKNGREPNKLLISFSVYSNGKKLFNTTRNTSPNAINCLNGLRAMSVFWIIFGHQFLDQQRSPILNRNAIAYHYNHIYSTILSSYNLAVDTFLVMGALLVTISTLNDLNKKTLNIPRMILHRYLRYTPVFAALILFGVSIHKFSFDQPIVNKTFITCERYWWTSLLHIQNYVNPHNLCAPHAWYLSVDFQLFIISPFLIYPAWRWGWKYLWSLPVLAIMSSVYALTFAIKEDFRVVYRSYEYDELIYYPTHARMGPWILGMVLGYMMWKLKNKKVEINKRLNAFCWITSISILLTVVLLAQPLNQQIDNQTGKMFNAFYIAFHRLAWALAVCWVIFACQKLKTGGIIRWFLSLTEWQPIATMSLSMYLAHLYYEASIMSHLKHAVTFEIWPMLHLFWGNVVAVAGISVVLYLTFEAPALLIENHFYAKWRQKEKIRPVSAIPN